MSLPFDPLRRHKFQHSPLPKAPATMCLCGRNEAHAIHHNPAWPGRDPRRSLDIGQASGTIGATRVEDRPMAPDTEAQLKTESAAHDSRCRYCWAVVSRGEPVAANRFGVYFHVECPKQIQPFPVIGTIDEKGEYVGPEIPDHPYATRAADMPRGMGTYGGSSSS
jgi:hypothetical protein